MTERIVTISESKTMSNQEKIEKTIELIVQYGGFDGSHHKDWVLDQAVRILAGDDYDTIVKEACNGEDGPDTYSWEVGIPP